VDLKCLEGPSPSCLCLNLPEWPHHGLILPEIWSQLLWQSNGACVPVQYPTLSGYPVCILIATPSFVSGGPLLKFCTYASESVAFPVPGAQHVDARQAVTTREQMVPQCNCGFHQFSELVCEVVRSLFLSGHGGPERCSQVM
jgi:hypothetical protein